MDTALLRLRPTALVVHGPAGDPRRSCARIIISHHTGGGELVGRAESARRGDGLVRHGPLQSRGGLVHRAGGHLRPPAAYGGGIPRRLMARSPSRRSRMRHQAVTASRCKAHRPAVQYSRWRIRWADRRAAHRGARLHADTIAVDRIARARRGQGSQLGWLVWLTPAGVGARPLRRAAVRADVLTDFGRRTLSSEHLGSATRTTIAAPLAVLTAGGWGGLRAAGPR